MARGIAPAPCKAVRGRRCLCGFVCIGEAASPCLPVCLYSVGLVSFSSYLGNLNPAWRTDTGHHFSRTWHEFAAGVVCVVANHVFWLTYFLWLFCSLLSALLSLPLVIPVVLMMQPSSLSAGLTLDLHDQEQCYCTHILKSFKSMCM